ncbi:MAG: methyltransferase [Candidatus Thermoplasmatota archaeon]|nr:methyltransferase [Candidatus Thermoplasmatota archaeon]
MQSKACFHYKSLTIHLHPEVYEPAEDTFLLLKKIDVCSNDTVFEIGTGTGIIALFCAVHGAQVVCSDINPYAVELAKRNTIKNKSLLTGSIEIYNGDMFKALHQKKSFDLIIFNPPYLPTSTDEYVGGSGWFDKAVSGGPSGLKITKRFLNKLPFYLKDDGRAFCIFSTNSPRAEFNQTLKENNLISTIVAKQSFDDETIEVHRIKKD